MGVKSGSKRRRTGWGKQVGQEGWPSVLVRAYVCVCMCVCMCACVCACAHVRCCTHALVEPVRLPSHLGRQVLSGKKGSRGTRHASLSS